MQIEPQDIMVFTALVGVVFYLVIISVHYRARIKEEVEHTTRTEQRLLQLEAWKVSHSEELINKVKDIHDTLESRSTSEKKDRKDLYDKIGVVEHDMNQIAQNLAEMRGEMHGRKAIQEEFAAAVNKIARKE